MADLCIYHGGCTDGVAAAWAMWKRHPDVTFYPGTYQDEPPYELAAGVDVFLVDFSYKRPVLEQLLQVAASVTILDHHKTAEDDLVPLLEQSRIKGVFDMQRCGALITWHWFWPKEAAPLMLEYIDRQDRWQDSRDPEMTSGIRTYPHHPVDDTPKAWEDLMITWDWLMDEDNVDQVKDEGRAVYRYYRQRVDETKAHALPMTIGTFVDVPVVNAPYYLASDVAGELAIDAPDHIAAVFWVNGENVTFSLRARSGADVSALAVSYGGGGHPGAAGFKVPFNQFVTMYGR